MAPQHAPLAAFLAQQVEAEEAGIGMGRAGLAVPFDPLARHDEHGFAGWQGGRLDAGQQQGPASPDWSGSGMGEMAWPLPARYRVPYTARIRGAYGARAAGMAAWTRAGTAFATVLTAGACASREQPHARLSASRGRASRFIRCGQA